ncbi:peptidase M15B and M15C [Rathayibacter sp. VKM Ac-2803]|uniref:M15 family metallopeptidase n=1 Tax=Rathayibacter sp. VKM Ac-2803 TaxID=2609256 RepID=UPI00135677ED|nr:M15 family metallopeptidase [Rathayibacter sp. VKM Ac-2803]MWV48086.1 peptidase M15B and M15C [Rathayibacter sp. VKM Ac-2803]
MTQQNSRRRRAALTAAVLVATLGPAACAAAEPDVPGGSVDPSATSDGRTADDGVIADGEPVSILDGDLPAIAGLDPALRSAVEAASDAAGADGVEMVVTSGWRSADYQRALLDDAVHEYGGYEEARRWVSTPELSAHVTGDAVDIGDTDANSWLSQHGADHGLCQTYGNEMWHFELATEPGGECPPQKQDAAG